MSENVCAFFAIVGILALTLAIYLLGVFAADEQYEKEIVRGNLIMAEGNMYRCEQIKEASR